MNVQRWLQGLGLEQYASAFHENDVDGETLRHLTEADLLELGVKSVGHRRRLALAIAALGQQASAPLPAAANDHDEAESRQLTVVYCEMAGAAADLAATQDPEARRELAQHFHRVCVEITAEHEGHVANFYGDRMLIYFGWPQAHEDDVQRAVRCALAMVGRLGAIDGVAASRAGIGTGPVVVGDLIREGPARQQSAVGMTPNVAARVLALARPGDVVIDAATQQILGFGFASRSLGTHQLKGISDPVEVFLIEGEREIDRFDAHGGGAVLPMVGREQELALLRSRWVQAQQGEGAAVHLTGEAGVGKSRIVRALLDECDQQSRRLVRWQCSANHSDSALWPVVEHSKRESGLDASAAGASGRSDEADLLHARLLGTDAGARGAALEMTPEMLRERTLGMLIDRLFDRADPRALLLVVEDAHWIDATTLELLQRCLANIEPERALIIVTSRQADRPALGAHPSMTSLSVSRLRRSSVEALVRQIAGDGLLSPQLLATLVSRADGVPLFAEELTKAMLETPDAVVPASLHGSLMARLDRLPEAKGIAQVAACIGREFDLALLRQVVDQPEIVEAVVARLAGVEMLFPRGDRTAGVFAFKHALLQETARASLLPSRRRSIHARILEVLERERRDTPHEVLAQHAAAAQLQDRAIVHWLEAGKAAQASSAFVEAAALMERALETIHAQRDGVDRRAMELQLAERLGQVRMATDGISSPAVGQAYHQALVLLEAGVHEPSRLPVRYGLWNWYYARGELENALGQVQGVLAVEEDRGTPESQLLAQRWAATIYNVLGELDRANALYERVLPLMQSEWSIGVSRQFPFDQRLSTLYQYGLMRCIQGHAAHSRQVMRQASDLCTASTASIQQAYLHMICGICAALERDVAAVAEEAAALARLATMHSLERSFGAFIDMFSVWGALEAGNASDAQLERYARGLERNEASSMRLFLPFLVARLAESLAARGRHDEARAAIERASRVRQETHQGWCDAELWRVQAQVALHDPKGDRAWAVSCLRQGLAQAGSRGAGLWELRCALGLARLPQPQAARDEAAHALALALERTGADADTADAREARALLEALVSG